MEVDADDPWFDRRRVKVTNRGDMAADGLVSVHAMLRYGANHEDVTLTTTNAEATVEWASIMENGAVKPEVEAEYTVHLKPDPSGERPNSVSSPKSIVLGEVLEIQPADLYAIVKVPIIASPNYPWDKLVQAQVTLRYFDPDKGIRIEDSFILDKAKPNADWKFLALDRAKRTFEYRISHRAANNADIDSGWIATDRELIDIRDPIGAKRLRIDVSPVVARWDDVEQMFVDLEYDDPANDFRETASLAFTPTDHAAKPFIVDLRDKDRRTVAFTATTLMKGGAVLEVPRRYTEAPRILVRPDMKGWRIVSVRPPADFRKDKIEKVTVELRYVDDAAGLSTEDRMMFEGGGGRKKFEYEYVDPAQDRYQWRASFLFENGMTTALDWREVRHRRVEYPDALTGAKLIPEKGVRHVVVRRKKLHHRGRHDLSRSCRPQSVLVFARPGATGQETVGRPSRPDLHQISSGHGRRGARRRLSDVFGQSAPRSDCRAAHLVETLVGHARTAAACSRSFRRRDRESGGSGLSERRGHGGADAAARRLPGG